MLEHLRIFRLGPWTVEPQRGAVTGPNGETQHLEPKVMDVLVCLAAHEGEIVARNQLLDSAWSASTGADELLTRAIGELRRVFHDSPATPEYIETIPKRGYRLIKAIHPASPEKPEYGVLPPGRSAIRSVRTIGLIVAALLVSTFLYVRFFETANETIVDNSPAGIKSIAVLPFVNMSGDPDNEYFSDGLSEELLNLLAQFPELKVIGRTSSFSFKGKNEDLRLIGRMLGVDILLEGSVRKVGDRIRITSKLVNALDGTTIWSDSYDRILADVFAVQDEIAAAILDELQLHVGTDSARRKPTFSVEAYALFLQAMASLNIQDAGSAELALLQATTLDPNFAKAHELLAHLYWTQYEPGNQPRDFLALMAEAAGKALAANPDLVLARSLLVMGNSEIDLSAEVIASLLEAARAAPNDPLILRTLTWELLITGYLNEALRAAQRFVEVDPLSSIAHVRYAAALVAVGQVSDSAVELEVAASLAPGTLDWYFGEKRLKARRDKEAIAYMVSDLERQGYPAAGWVESLVTEGRDPASGGAYLDNHIPEIVRSAPPHMRHDLTIRLNILYLLLGHLDRYFEIVLDHVPDNNKWSGGSMYLWYGLLHRDLGFTAHPKYLEVAELTGSTAVWEHRGPPDFCSKSEGVWRCM